MNLGFFRGFPLESSWEVKVIGPVGRQRVKRAIHFKTMDIIFSMFPSFIFAKTNLWVLSPVSHRPPVGQEDTQE